MATRALALGFGLSLGAAAAAACGSSESDETGFNAGNDASVDVFLGSDASIWPDADPAPDSGAGPSPGFDAGDAGPSGVTCSNKPGKKGSALSPI